MANESPILTFICITLSHHCAGSCTNTEQICAFQYSLSFSLPTHREHNRDFVTQASLLRLSLLRQSSKRSQWEHCLGKGYSICEGEERMGLLSLGQDYACPTGSVVNRILFQFFFCPSLDSQRGEIHCGTEG